MKRYKSNLKKKLLGDLYFVIVLNHKMFWSIMILRSQPKTKEQGRCNKCHIANIAFMFTIFQYFGGQIS